MSQSRLAQLGSLALGLADKERPAALIFRFVQLVVCNFGGHRSLYCTSPRPPASDTLKYWNDSGSGISAAARRRRTARPWRPVWPRADSPARRMLPMLA